jgi:hypothetical protein
LAPRQCIRSGKLVVIDGDVRLDFNGGCPTRSPIGILLTLKLRVGTPGHGPGLALRGMSISLRT